MTERIAEEMKGQMTERITGQKPGQMKRVNALRAHPLYQKYYQELEELEKDRIFCRHQMPHLLDVARIAWILNLERGLGFDREVVYAAAVLHDIGKALQYTEKIPHEKAGEEIAAQILGDLPDELAFSEEEMQMIRRAIAGHRRWREDMEPLESLLYESDKRSRQCFACPAESECDWSPEKKNLEIDI